MLLNSKSLALVLAVLMALAGLGAGVAQAVQPDEVLADQALETRARAISHGIRCLVCQNQSIDDSDAPLARDLRLLVRERLVAGDSDAEVQTFLVSRYGDFVLLKPPLNASTLVLWLMPLLLLAGAAAIVVRQMRAQRVARSQPPLSADEERSLRDLLTKNSRESSELGP